MGPKVVTGEILSWSPWSPVLQRYSGRLVSVGVDVARLRPDPESRGLLPSPLFQSDNRLSPSLP